MPGGVSPVNYFGASTSPFSILGSTTTQNPTSTFGNPATFTAAANAQANDYDTIMGQYSKIANSNPVTSTPIAPVTPNYTQSGDVTSSISDLSNLATTGGYTPQMISDIRARDISPIRSIYATDQQNVNQQRALGGGYSPNFDATQAEMARDESNQIANVTTAANAGIDQNIVANELAATPAYASAAAGANAAQTQANQNNANIVNSINQANRQSQQVAQQANANINLAGTQGMQSLYGTTPALTSTFGNQVVQAANLGQNQQGLNNQRLAVFGGIQ